MDTDTHKESRYHRYTYGENNIILDTFIYIFLKSFTIIIMLYNEIILDVCIYDEMEKKEIKREKAAAHNLCTSIESSEIHSFITQHNSVYELALAI